MRRPQEDHADLGLVDNDNTEDMRTAPVNPSADTLGEGRLANLPEKKGS